MLKSNRSDFNPLLILSVQFKKSSAAFFQLIAQQQITPLRLMLLLGFTGISWLATATVAPQIAQAYTARVNLSINRQVGESFNSFLRRAEAIARAATQRSFDSDILVTDVSVTVIGQNQGAIIPILLLEVSRQSWRGRPDPQSWTTYFPDTQTLLGFEQEPLVDAETQVPGGQPPPPPGSPGVPGAPGVPGGVPGAPANTTQPTAPTNIDIPDIPGAPIRRFPNQPQAPNQAPANTTQPTAPTNIDIPDIPGAPIQRFPNPTQAPAPNAPATQQTGQ
ncbi:hypothetical protein H6F98_10295 [Microcoleus sp. FACHB-SPT15]|uniref:hypothetical protein n=1 Tax=Microcoleus sp. FACHB-SPT15 TaxID=2692830 RepID=UPI0017825FD5|nr:hypothetical protein [Microcoleus sp. FACHB-SPT15]MBD1805839.1 hypothetical protein [Microcoleus sp. FACHB-SPT15]